MDMGTAGDVAEMSSRAGSSPVSPYQNRRPTEMACTQCHRQKQKVSEPNGNLKILALTF
jgi:hypothetical protein